METPSRAPAAVDWQHEMIVVPVSKYHEAATPGTAQAREVYWPQRAPRVLNDSERAVPRYLAPCAARAFQLKLRLTIDDHRVDLDQCSIVSVQNRIRFTMNTAGKG